MFEVKGNNTDPTNGDPTFVDGDPTIDEFNESISGLDRDNISQIQFEDAISYSNRSGNNTDTSYAFDEMIPLSTHPQGKSGGRSMINEYAIFHHPACKSVNDFRDIEGQPGAFPKYTVTGQNGIGSGGRMVTIESLLDQFAPNTTPSTPYSVSDFLYAKYYGRIPLNHLITLRRFPFPVYDSLAFADGNQYKPLAQAITYFGEPTGNMLKDFTKISGFINWQELEANVHDVDGNERGLDNTPFIPRGVGKVISLANGDTDLSGRRQAQQDAAKNYSDPSYTGRTLGPVNVVNKTNIRDRGIGAEQEFSLVFEYSLRSINSINPRIAMLDIICNMLALTFNNAKFWGGANRYFPKLSQYGFIGDQQAYYSGDYGTYIDSFLSEIGTAAQTGFDIFTSMIRNLFSGNFKDLFTSIAKGVGTTILDLKSAKSRPQVLGFKALLTGDPVGEWHLTIGNPHQPIMRIGNLICTGFEMEFDEELGVDDFPTGMRWVVNLKYGRPRDKGDIESLFNYGQGRIYHAPPNTADALNLSSTTEVQVVPDNGRNVNNPARGTDDPGESNNVLEASSGRGLSDESVSSDYIRRMEGTVF